MVLNLKYFRPTGLTEVEAIDEAIKESLQQHKDDYQQSGPVLCEEISEEELIEDIKNHVSQHVNGQPRNTVVSRLSVWETAAPHFKKRKFADAKGLLEVTLTALRRKRRMPLIWEDQEESFCLCFLGLFARVARLSQAQTVLSFSVYPGNIHTHKNFKGERWGGGGSVSKAKYFRGKLKAKLKLSKNKNWYGYFLEQTKQ